MAPPATNTDLPASWKIPGVYTQINFTGGGAAVDDDSKRALVFGYRSSTGTGIPDTPQLFIAQSDVNTAHGQGSDVARIFAALQSQFAAAGIVEVWVIGITPPSSGTAATYTITFGGPATAAGSIDFYVCGYRASIGVANGDTATIVCTNLYNELVKLVDLPCTFTDSGSGTLTLTERHKGILGNDLPIRVDQVSATGITISNGIVTYATNATGGGSATVTIGATTVSATITNGDTPTTVAGNVRDAINGGDYPVTATANAGVLTLYPRLGRYCRRVTAAIVTSTGMTATVSLHGTTGAGVPTMTTAIANWEALKKGFSAVVNPFNDTAGTPTLTAIYNSVVVQENGINQKGPFVFTGAVATLANSGAIVTSPSPNLTASPRFAVCWSRESPQQAYELAARCAGVYMDDGDYPPNNVDGAVLRTRGALPLLNPATADIQTDADVNSALLSYYLTPLRANSRDQLTVIRGRTTSNAENADLHEWSTMRQVDRARPQLNARLGSLFSDKVYRTSTPKTPNAITTSSVKDAVYVWVREKDDRDEFDDAASVKDAIKVSPNATVKTKFDVFVPFNLIRPLHQLGVSLSPSSP